MARSVGPRYGQLGLGVLLLVFLASVALVNVVFRGVRLDLTEAGLYTLSEGTQRVLEGIPEPVRLYFFISRGGLSDSPGLRAWADRVEDMLIEFEAHSDGRLDVSVIDPAPFSEDEDRAAAFGLQAVRLQVSDDPLYFGVAGSNAVGDEEFIAFMNPQREQFLEYDLAKLVHSLSRSDEPVVGLVSSLPLTGGFDPMQTAVTEPWIITSPISDMFDLRDLDIIEDEIDEEVDVLMLVHPKVATPRQSYAFEQFLFRGGRALVFIDPLAEADPAAPPAGPMAGMPADRSSNLEFLLGHWGLEMPAETVVGDGRYALRVSEVDGTLARHPAYIGVDLAETDSTEVVTAELDVLNLGFAGYLKVNEDAALEVTPLVRTSNDAGFLDPNLLAFTPDINSLWSGFNPQGEAVTLAARLSGTVASAFPDGRPEAPEDQADGEADDANPFAEAMGQGGTSSLPGEEEEPELSELPEHIAEGEVQLIVVADTDLLSDRMWAQAQRVFGQLLVTEFASNGNFVLNALDQLAGSSDLMSLRGRAAFSRPFDRVDELRLEAEAQFRLTEDRLQEELVSTENRLAELQEARDDQFALSPTPEQEAELEKFTDERLRIRRELREVRRNLDASIQRLGAFLKVINIGLIPLLIGIGGLAVALLRRRNRKGRGS
ncbi:MAG: Gldg family protein [Gammaproteobacteria bacterium]|nr:Gldg family protein [Gammaproteobacteria bacterium]MDE0454356.1 Gldg family protein [Gammaproteobacteria bacterium]